MRGNAAGVIDLGRMRGNDSGVTDLGRMRGNDSGVTDLGRMRGMMERKSPVIEILFFLNMILMVLRAGGAGEEGRD